MFDALDDQSLASAQSNLSAVGRDYARRSIPWLRLAGFTFIILGALAILSSIATMFQHTTGPDQLMPNLLTVAFLSVGVYLGVLLLYQASNYSKYVHSNDAQSVDDGLANARFFWKTAAIFTIVITVMTILSILFVFLFFRSFNY